jgi:hypothetical protein
MESTTDGGTFRRTPLRGSTRKLKRPPQRSPIEMMSDEGLLISSLTFLPKGSVTSVARFCPLDYETEVR